MFIRHFPIRSASQSLRTFWGHFGLLQKLQCFSTSQHPLGLNQGKGQHQPFWLVTCLARNLLHKAMFAWGNESTVLLFGSQWQLWSCCKGSECVPAIVPSLDLALSTRCGLSTLSMLVAQRVIQDTSTWPAQSLCAFEFFALPAWLRKPFGLLIRSWKSCLCTPRGPCAWGRHNVEGPIQQA